MGEAKSNRMDAAPAEIGLDQEGPLGGEAMFALKAIHKAGGREGQNQCGG